jgi:hypothetical protein
MRIGPNEDFILEADGGFLVLSLPNEREVKMGMAEVLILVELQGCACLVFSRTLWHEYLAAGPPPDSDRQPSLPGLCRWALQSPSPVGFSPAGERLTEREERRTWKEIADIFDTLGPEANMVIAAVLVGMDLERARLGNIAN